MTPDPKTLLTLLPRDTQEVLRAVGRLEAPVYLVGGAVRDALLGRSSRDLDLVVEGDVWAVGTALRRTLGGDLSCFEPFLTCTLKTSGFVLDLATARRERYTHPGALPEVRPASLREDLFRRDFTVNALAVRLTPEPPQLLDPYGGLEDLRRGLLCTLHPTSFFDDPTRVVRGARLTGRLGFRFSEAAEAELAASLRAGAHAQVSPARFKNELLFTLSEPQVAPALELLEGYGALEAFYGLRAVPLLHDLDAARRTARVPDESYLLALLVGLTDEELAVHTARFGWPKRLLEARGRLLRGVGDQVNDLETLSEAEKSLLRVFNPALKVQLERLEASQARPRLRGQDVLDLGLPAGPEVGDVLRAVSRARATGRVGSFAEEVEFAEELVREYLKAAPRQERA